MKIKQGLTFDDVLLIPKYSEVESRADVDLSVDLSKGIILDIPIISANMMNVTGYAMAVKIAKLGGLALLHRFNSIAEQASEYIRATQGFDELISKVGISVGVKDEDYDRVDELLGKRGCKIICIDIAHGHSILAAEMCKYIKDTFPNVLLIAGNVATLSGAKFLYDCGADVIKVGIGAGSLCSTRIKTGNGVPSITMLEEIHSWRESKKIELKHYPFKLIMDGGIKASGDIIKSLCFADAIMLGNLLAGTDEAPGEIVVVGGKSYKEYNGSSTHKNKNIEGVKAHVPLKGPVNNVVNDLLDGIRSGLSYQGCFNLDELKQDPEFITITNSGLNESHPHSVVMLNK